METSKETSRHSFCYGSDELKSFAEKSAFLDPMVGKILDEKAPGKRILDIGCGTGDWCYQAAKYGAKSVDGFDKQEKMAVSQGYVFPRDACFHTHIPIGMRVSPHAHNVISLGIRVSH